MQQVLVRIKEIGNEKSIVAYYKTTETISRKELISYLKERLPEYMIPSYFVEMTAFPLTSQVESCYRITSYTYRRKYCSAKIHCAFKHLRKTIGGTVAKDIERRTNWCQRRFF